MTHMWCIYSVLGTILSSLHISNSQSLLTTLWNGICSFYLLYRWQKRLRVLPKVTQSGSSRARTQNPEPGRLTREAMSWMSALFRKWFLTQLHLLKVKKWSRVWLFATPWTAAYQDPPSMGFSRQECWSAISFSRGSSRARNRTPVSRTAGRRFTVWAPREAIGVYNVMWIIR